MQSQCDNLSWAYTVSLLKCWKYMLSSKMPHTVAPWWVLHHVSCETCWANWVLISILFYLLLFFLELSESVPPISFGQNPYLWIFICSCAVKNGYLLLLCWLMYCILLIDLVLGLILHPGSQNLCFFALYSTTNSRFIIMLIEADLKGFLNYGSGTQSESQACFSVGPRMSEVCFNEPPVQGWVINFDAFWSHAEWAEWSCGWWCSRVNP